MVKMVRNIMHMAAILLVGCMFMGTVCLAAESTVSEDGKYSYELLADGTAKLTKCRMENGIAVIPDKVDGYLVTVISTNCFYVEENLKEITIPGTVKELESKAFYHCTNLKKVTFSGDGLEKIGERAFFSCSLEQFSFPSTVKEVGEAAFGYAAFSSIVIPKSVNTWGKSIFYASRGLTSVTFEEGITVIPKSMFSSCHQLVSITLPESLLTIEEDALSCGGTIPELVLPAGLQRIAVNAFSGTKIDKLIVKCDKVQLDKNAMYNSRVNNLYCSEQSTFYEYYKNISITNIVRTGIYMDKTEAEIKVGKTLQLSVVNPEGATTWTSSKPKVATVSGSGLVKGVSPGKAVITAVNNGVTMTCTITVKDIGLDKTNGMVTVGYTTKLKLEGGKKVKWSSSNKKVATVSSKGVVKGLKKGKATITASCNGRKYKFKVTVKENSKVLPSYSVLPSDYPAEHAALGFGTITEKNGTYVIDGHFINNYSKMIAYVSNLQILVYSEGKLIAKQSYSKYNVNVSPRSFKKISFTIGKSNIKKKVDLRTKSVKVEFKSGSMYGR